MLVTAAVVRPVGALTLIAAPANVRIGIVPPTAAPGTGPATAIEKKTAIEIRTKTGAVITIEIANRIRL